MRFLSPSQVVLTLLILIMVPAHAKDKPSTDSKTDLQEIQAGIMSFADTWASALRQTAAVAKESVESTEDRLFIERRTYFAILNAYDIAAGPYPGVAMLDMMVMASLSKAVSERFLADRLGESGRPMVNVLGQLESEIWRFSEAYLGAPQRQALRELVNEWLEQHPNARSASFIRLSDFGELGRKPTLEAAVKKGGFLAPIRDAAESAEEIKQLAERGLFLSIRMHELMVTRAELMKNEMIASPEVVGLLNDISGFRESAERYAQVAETLPTELEALVASTISQVSTEREVALNQALDGLTAERVSAITQVMEGVALERELTLDQALEGLRQERLGVLKATGHIMYWLELEIRAAFVRLLIIAACLMVLWYGLRLIYRYWVDRVANSFIKVLGVALLLVVITAPIMVIGHVLVGMVAPDFAAQSDVSRRMDVLLEQVHDAPINESASD